MKRAFSFASAMLALTIYACAAKPPPSKPDVAQEDEKSDRVRKRGFAVGRPPNSSWYVDMKEQEPGRFVARRDMSEARYIFVFQASLSRLEREPKSLVDFADLARQNTVLDPTRQKVVTYEQTTETLQEQWCIRYSKTAVEYENDLFAGAPLNVRVNGVICKHPSWPDVALHMRYSSRGSVRDFKPELDAEAEVLLKSVTIETEQGNPFG
jgi:hypothetical protein